MNESLTQIRAQAPVFMISISSKLSFCINIWSWDTQDQLAVAHQLLWRIEIQPKLDILDNEYISLFFRGGKKKVPHKTRFRSNLLSVVYAIYLKKKKKWKNAFFRDNPCSYAGNRKFWFFYYSTCDLTSFQPLLISKCNYRNQGHHVEFLHSQGTYHLEAGEWIVIRHKYSIFNPDIYKPVPITFPIL